MFDHFHALVGTGDSGLTLGDICGRFQSLSTRRFWKYEDGRLWQRQFFDHVIRNHEDFWECVEYIRMNPVTAGLVSTPGEWRYYGEPDLKGY
jgi:REP element-mobilizing transposase RayT